MSQFDHESDDQSPACNQLVRDIKAGFPPTMEDVTRYWNARPCNVLHSSYPQDSLQYSREVTAKKYLVEPHIPGFAIFYGWGGKRVLDVGCGIGTDALEFAKAGAKVTAIDVSAQSIRIANLRAMAEIREYEPLRNLWFDIGDAESSLTWLPGWPFDLVYSFGALHHTPHPEFALRQLSRVMKRDGQLRIMLYHRWSTKAMGIYVSHVWATWTAKWFPDDPKDFDQVVAQRSEAQPGCPITHTYSKKSATAMLEAAGFQIRSMYVEHIFPYDGEKYGQGLYVKKWYWRSLPAWLFRKLERTFGWHLCIIAELR